MTDYQSIRQNKLTSVQQLYDSTLADYISMFNTYLQNPQAVSQHDIAMKNNQLVEILQQLNANNTYVDAEADVLFDKFSQRFQGTKIANISQQLATLQERNTDLVSVQQLITQLKASFRRQRIIYWVSMIFMLLLLGGVGFLSLKMRKKILVG